MPRVDEALAGGVFDEQADGARLFADAFADAAQPAAGAEHRVLGPEAHIIQELAQHRGLRFLLGFGDQGVQRLLHLGRRSSPALFLHLGRGRLGGFRAGLFRRGGRLAAFQLFFFRRRFFLDRHGRCLLLSCKRCTRCARVHILLYTFCPFGDKPRVRFFTGFSNPRHISASDAMSGGRGLSTSTAPPETGSVKRMQAQWSAWRAMCARLPP